MIALGFVSCAAASSPPDPVPVAEIVTPQTDPVVKLAQAAEQTKQEARKVATKPDVSNEYLIQIIGLVHKLDVAVAVMKKHRTKATMAAVKDAVAELHRVAK